MTIHFHLKYRSVYGQQFFVSGNIPELGNGDPAKAIALEYLNSENWYVAVQVKKNSPPFSYHYILRNDGGLETPELETDRIIDLQSFSTKDLQLQDSWNWPGEYQNAFYTKPFTLHQNSGNSKKKGKLKTAGATETSTHLFRIKSPLLAEHETMCLLGNHELLGNWEQTKALPMHRNGHWYELSLKLTGEHFPLAYKYGIWNNSSNSFTRYEDGDNRILHESGSKQMTIVHDGFAQLPNNNFKGTGVAIPVFSLRSKKSWGTGEFSDIKLLANWCSRTGIKLIQLLPINDTSATHTRSDSYPYAAISAFALHPLYLNVESMAGKKNAGVIKPLMTEAKALNALPGVDYTQVIRLKWKAIEALYPLMKTDWLADKHYQEYLQQNQHWLLPYAVFCSLRTQYKTPDFERWKKHGVYDAATVAQLSSPQHKNFDTVAIHLFVQYHLHLQLKDAVQHAHKLGLALKGDIPIGIFRHSCDAWMQPELYHMHEQAGAPPDPFAVNGQNWGFPTYNWQRMQQDGFSWWKQRFEQMSHYFDAFRIDHILGFFRIWSIPLHAVQGIMGRFVPCKPIHVSELHDKGIWFNYERYCQPYIYESRLEELFGEQKEWVVSTFLESLGWSRFAFKSTLNTQRSIEDWFAQHKQQPAELKEKLFSLISNVIFLEEPGSEGQLFHFRFDMQHTNSFKHLDEYTQTGLKELYEDYFYHRQNEDWKKEAVTKLTALKAGTDMLICGEDLGMVPTTVPDVMKNLGLLSLEVQRMPKDSSRQFFHPADAPYLSVVTPSTHDMSTIRGWWEEDETITQEFYAHELGQQGKPPKHCEPWICRAIITQHMYSPAMWSIFQLQDLLGMDGRIRHEQPEKERINIPADPHHYWHYRMHLYLEDLIKEDYFNKDLKSLVDNAGR